MSFRLPRPCTVAREALGELSDVAEILNPANIERLPEFSTALRNARRFLATEPAAKRVNIICLRADDQRWLISVGPRGGWKRLWNFGTGRD